VWQSPDPALPDNLAKLPEDDVAAVRGPEADLSTGTTAVAHPRTNVAAPTFLNLYNYADANPLTKTDPDGKATRPAQQDYNSLLRENLIAHFGPGIRYVKPDHNLGLRHWLEGSGRPLYMRVEDVQWSVNTKDLEKFSNGHPVVKKTVGAQALGSEAENQIGHVTGQFTGKVEKTKTGFHAVGTFAPYDDKYDFDMAWYKGSANGAILYGKYRGERRRLEGGSPKDYYTVFEGPPVKIDMSWKAQ
jgi:hypothetical protein